MTHTRFEFTFGLMKISVMFIHITSHSQTQLKLQALNASNFFWIRTGPLTSSLINQAIAYVFVFPLKFIESYGLLSSFWNCVR